MVSFKNTSTFVSALYGNVTKRLQPRGTIHVEVNCMESLKPFGYLLTTVAVFLAQHAAAQSCLVGFPAEIEVCEGGQWPTYWSDWQADTTEWVGMQWDSPSGVASDSLPAETPVELDAAGWWTYAFYGAAGDTCVDSLQVTILPQPLAAFSATDGVCGNEGVAFTNQTTGGIGVEYTWTFGDGTPTSSLTSPTHLYAAPGGGAANFSVTLTAANGDGSCPSSVTESVAVLQVPTPNFNDAPPLCQSDANWPNYTLVLPPYAPALSWHLDWGNGTDTSFSAPSFAAPPNTTYNSFGYFDITLTVEAANGCSNVIVQEVFVGSNPTIGTANPGNTVGLCSPAELVFPITEFASNVEGTTYTVEFGDGTAATYSHPPPSSVSHTYYDDSCGEITPEGSMNALRFKVTASNECGTSISTHDPIRLHRTPDPQLTGPTAVCEGSYEYLVDGEGLIVTDQFPCDESDVYWSVNTLSGSGFASVSPGVGTWSTVWYSDPGLYEVTVYDYHPYCEDGQDTLEVCVVAPPSAGATLSATSGCAPLTVDFSAVSQQPALCGTYAHQWGVSGGSYGFANGTSASSASPSFVFYEQGTYTVTQTVSALGVNCNPVTASFQVEVYSAPSIEVSSGGVLCEGDVWDLSVTSWDDGGDDDANFYWIIEGEDVFNPIGSTLQIVLDDDGIWSANAYLINACGIASDQSNMIVNVTPDLQVTVPPAACAGSPQVIQVSGADDYSWTPGYDNLVPGNDAATYSPDFNQTVTITGTNSYTQLNCEASVDVNLLVNPLPIMNLSNWGTTCEGEWVDVVYNVSSGTPDFTFAWNYGGQAAAGPDPEFSAAVGVDQISVTVTDAQGCVDSATASGNVVALPYVEAGELDGFCDQAIDTVLTPVSAPGGVWSGTGISPDGVLNPADLGVGSWAVTYGYTDPLTGCYNEDDLVIDVFAPEFADAGADLALCDVDTVLEFTGFSPATQGVWEGPGELVDAALGTFDVSALVPGTHTFTYTYGTGTCATTDSREVTIWSNPGFSIIADDLTVCDGDEAVVTASAFGGSNTEYTITLSGEGWTVLPNDQASTVVAWGEEPEIFGMVVDGNGCVSEEALSIEVLPLPEVTILDTLLACDQSILEPLPSAMPEGGFWTGAGVTDPLGWFNPSIPGAGSAEVIYTYSDGQGCTNADTSEVVIEAPINANAGPGTTVCDVDTLVQLTGFSPADGTWSGLGLSPDGLWDAGPLAPGDYEVTYAFGEGSCATEDVQTLTVLARPELTIAGPLELCLGDSAHYSAEAQGAGAPFYYEWFAPVASIGSTASFLPTEPGLFTVEAFVTDANGCSEWATFTTLVHALPAVDAGPDVTLCNQPIPVLLEGATPQPGSYAGGAAVEPDGWYNPSVSGLGEHEVIYTHTDPLTGCTSSDTLVVEVVAPVEADAGPDWEVCLNGGEVTFAPGTTGEWSGVGSVAGLVHPDDGTVDPMLTGVGVHEFVLSYGGASCLTRDTVVLEVLALPVLDVEPSSAFCLNDSVVELPEALPAGGDWTGTGLVEGSAPQAFDALVGVGAWDLVYTYTDAQTGCTNAANHQVTVLGLPVVDAGPNLLLCNQPILEQLTGESPPLTPGNGYYGLGGAAAAVTEGGLFDPSVAGVGTFDVVYAFTDPVTGCVGRDTLEVEVAMPAVAEAGMDTVACANAPELVLEGAFPDNGTWFFGQAGGAPGALDGEAGVVTPQGLAPGDYTLLYTYGTGTCYTKDSLELTVHPLPEIQMGTPDVFCLNDTLMPLSMPVPATGTWFGTGVEGSEFNTLVGAGEYDIQYWVEDEVTGCRDTADHHVTVQALPLVFAGQNLTLCYQPIPETLTGYAPLTSGGGLGTWSGVGPVADAAVTADGVFDPSISGVGTFELVYTFTSYVSECTHSDTIEVDVVAPVVADAGMDTVACANAPLLHIVGFQPATGALWSGLTPAAQAALTSPTSGTINPQALAPGSYDFQIAIGSGTCYSADTMTVVVDPLPVLTLGADDAFCLNDTLMPLTSATPAGGTWEGTGVNGTQFNTLVGPGSYNLIYWYEEPLTGCRDTAAHVVEVYGLPVVEAGPDLVLCNQAIGEQLMDFSPGLAAGGVGVFTGLGAGAAAVSPSGWVEPSLAGVGTFEVVYAYTAAATSCTHTDTLTITVNEPVIAEAGLDTTVCANAPLLQLEGFSPMAWVNWFSDEAEAQAAVVDAAAGVVNPQALSPGEHTFAMEYGTGTCYTRDSMRVFVDALPELTLGDPNAWCGNLTDQTLSQAFPAGGTWFGPNVLDPTLGAYNVQQPAGNYAPAYTYTDPLTGCADTAFHSVTIHPVPVADFSVDTLACTNLPVAFTQLSTGASQAFWWFGDDDVSIEWEPTHDYPDPGFYTVTMRAASNDGCADTLTTELQITIPPTAAAVLTPTSGCSPLEVTFDNTSVAPFATFSWQVGNDPVTTAFEPAPTTFVATDTLLEVPVTLTVSNLCATAVFEDTLTIQPSPLLSFDLFADTACSPYALEILNTSVGMPESLTWHLGNGDVYSGWQPPATLYATGEEAADFTISLVGVNACGSDSISADFHLKPNTVSAFFEASATSGCAPLEAMFTDLSLNATAISFDFGNGLSSADSLAATTFNAPGDYLVQQFVTNGCAYDTIALAVEVFEQPSFTLSTDQIDYCTNETVQFTITAATSGSAAWDFGNATTGTGFLATTSYSAAGQYWAVAEVETALFSCSAEDSVEVTINPGPVWSIPPVDPGCSPFEVAFTNASTNAAFVTWEFNDGSSPAVAWAPTHTFTNATAAPLTYTVEVHAESADLCAADTAFSVAVLPTPDAQILLGSSTSCELPVDLDIENATTGAVASTWWFNGQLVGAVDVPEVTATVEGMQPLVLEAINAWGCTDRDTAWFTVLQQPVAALNVFPLTGCQILPVTFENQSVGAITSTLSVSGPSGVLFEGPLDGMATLELAEAGLHTANFTAVSADGCQVGLDVPQLIEVYPTPVAGFEATPLIGTPDQIDPLNDTWAFESTSTGATIWNWNFGDGVVAGGETTQHTYSGAGDFFVTLTAANAYGCMAQHEGWVRLSQLLQVFVPNAFTPPSLLNQQAGTGSRGLNDAFRPVFSDLDLVAEYEFTIVNRWGEVVFHSFDPTEYWVGEAVENGDYYAPDDTYVWTLYYQPTYEDIGVREVGHVTLIRD